jgi:hypothetical protein
VTDRTGNPKIILEFFYKKKRKKEKKKTLEDCEALIFNLF